MTSTAPLALGLTIAATATFANPIDVTRPDAPALAPYGDRVIGVQTMTFTDPGRTDILNVTEDATPTYDRPLTVEVWYPAAAGTTPGGEYRAFLRDGATEVTLTGRAARDAEPASGETFPLIVISHGYPGNRFLMSHLGENLASKGYVTVSIDHTDSTYNDQAAFGSTLYNRPLDQKFIIDAMESLEGPIGAIMDTSTTGVVGYSMGGYGALIFGGAGITEGAVGSPFSPPNGLLAIHQAGNEAHEAQIDPRVKSMVMVGPWGKNWGVWDETGVAGLRKPTLIMAGGVDDVSSYPAMRAIFDEATGTDRHLLTFNHANHNAAAPMPAPAESATAVYGDGELAYDHYADAVWDTTRMNNIMQHFATAFFDLHLKGADTGAYFDLVVNSDDGVVALDDAGKETADHTYWNGFAPRTAAGLRFETKLKGE